MIILKLEFLSDLFHSFFIKYLRTKDLNNTTEIFLHLSSKIMRGKYGAHYCHYVQFLIDNEFIILKKNYIAGSKSRKYQFLKATLNNHTVVQYENENWKLIYYYNRFPSADNDIYAKGLQTKIKANLNHVSLDYQSSSDYLNENIQDHSSRKYLKNISSIKDISDGNIYAEFDKYGRVHSNFTVLKKEIRSQHLYIDGQPIYERDIQNSQALFFLLLLSQNLDKTIDPVELKRFQAYIVSGKFYEDLLLISNTDRKTVKVAFFSYLFGIKYQKFQAFNDLYPTISAFLYRYKTIQKDYKIVSHQLQRMEGNFIFNGVSKELIRHKVIFFTVHDSICVKTDAGVILDEVFDSSLLVLKQEIDDNILEYYRNSSLQC